MYNLLIKDGINVFYEVVSNSKIIHLGTPADYQAFVSLEDGK